MIYLDYSATTPTNDEVLEYFIKINKNNFANPNSNYDLAQKSKQEIDNTTQKIKKLLNLTHHEIIYTSGSSESNNLAIKGAINPQRKNHIITTSFEHSSVIAPINYLQRNNVEVEIIKNNSNGLIEIASLEKLIKKETTLISITAVNSEIGILQPIEEIGEYLKQNHPEIVFHVDLTQLITKKKIDFTNIDLASISAHKFYGLKGIGCLIKNEKIKLTPIIHGGKSTTVYRSGTPPTSLIASLGKALEISYRNLEKNYTQTEKISIYLKEQLKTLPNIFINSNSYCIPHIINFSIINKIPTQVQEKLSQKSIYISTQTACSTSEISGPVYSLTQDKKRATTSLRASISHLTTKKEIDEFITCLKQIIEN